MRDAQKRTPEDASSHLGQFTDIIKPDECLNDIKTPVMLPSEADML